MDERKIHTSLAWSEEKITYQRNVANRMKAKFYRVLLLGDSRVKDFPRFFVTKSMVMSITWISLERARITDIPRMVKSVNPSIIDIMVVFMFHGDISIGGDGWCTALELRPLYAIELVRSAHAFIHQLKTTFNVSVIWINPTLINFCCYNSRVYEPNIEDYFRYHESIKLLTREWNTIVSKEFNVINFMLVNLNDLIYEPYDSQRIFDYMEKRNVDFHEMFPNSIPPIFSDGFHFTVWGMNVFLNKLPHYIFLNNHIQSSASYLGPNCNQDNLPTTKFRYCNPSSSIISKPVKSERMTTFGKPILESANYNKPHSKLKKKNNDKSIGSFISKAGRITIFRKSSIQSAIVVHKTSSQCSTSTSLPVISTNSTPNIYNKPQSRLQKKERDNPNRFIISKPKKITTFIKSSIESAIVAHQTSSESPSSTYLPVIFTNSTTENYNKPHSELKKKESATVENFHSSVQQSSIQPKTSKRKRYCSTSNSFLSSDSSPNSNRYADQSSIGTNKRNNSTLSSSNVNLDIKNSQELSDQSFRRSIKKKTTPSLDTFSCMNEKLTHEKSSSICKIMKKEKKSSSSSFISSSSEMMNTNKEKDKKKRTYRDCFSGLRKDHKNQYTTYQQNPETHPLYEKEFKKFKSDGHSHKWEEHWKNQLQKMFIMSWESKKKLLLLYYMKHKKSDSQKMSSVIDNFTDNKDCINSSQKEVEESQSKLSVFNKIMQVSRKDYNEVSISSEEKSNPTPVEFKLTDKSISDAIISNYISPPEIIKSGEVIKKKNVHHMEIDNNPHSVHKSNYVSLPDFIKSEGAIKKESFDNIKVVNYPQEVNKANYVSPPDIIKSEEVIKKEMFDNMEADNSPHKVYNSKYISSSDFIKSKDIIKKESYDTTEADNYLQEVNNSNYGSSNFSVKEEGIFDNMETDNNLQEVNKTNYISDPEFTKSKEVPEIKNDRFDTIEADNYRQEVNKANYVSPPDIIKSEEVIKKEIFHNMETDNNPHKVYNSKYISSSDFIKSKEIIKKESFDNYPMEVNDLSYRPKEFFKFNNTVEEELKPDCNLLNDYDNVMEIIKCEIVDHVNSDSCSSPDNFDYDNDLDELLNDPNFLNDLDQINRELHNI